MNKPIIAVDVDEVLVPHFQDLIDWYNHEYGTRLTLADNHPTDTTNWGTPSITEAVERVNLFFETETFRQMEPFVEAKEVLRNLGRQYELIVVTARDNIIEQATREWLDKHFAELFREVHFTARYSLEGKSRSKAEVCQGAGARFLIDDSADNIIEAAETGITGVLFGDYPWSSTRELPKNVTTCKDWTAVEEYFDGLTHG